MLSEINPHPRDPFLVFDEEPHTYNVTSDPDSVYTSCTTFIHEFFEKFDPDLVIKKMTSSKNWKNSRYFGKTPEEIKLEWETNRISASAAGTAMHKNIEDFYNGKRALEDFENLPDMKHFLSFYKTIGKDLQPYRSEWMIYDTELKLAGSIDFVTENSDQTLSIWDWKRSKEIKMSNDWQRGLKPVGNLPDTNFWHYSLQLNLYKALIEKNYEREVKEMALVVMHPDNESYLCLPVPDLQKEIQKLFRHRLGQPIESSDSDSDCSSFGFDNTVKCLI